ncbi:MAG: PQ-loop repeat-containing protein [Nanoarchaeota archaeon]|nr:PQ-loop repeat-containing protein [Nanoarchaeota archaeon]MCG2717593.1 PQ-loop repeat-containing protein [Nanoarchaeota archaeon]
MIDLITILGSIGVGMIAISWIPQLVKTVKEKKSGLSFNFTFAQLIGSLMLIIYAFMAKQTLFFILNGLASILVAINLWYVLKKVRK